MTKASILDNSFKSSHESSPKVYAMIVAAGTGSRYGADIPKQYLKAAGKTIVQHSVAKLVNSKYINDCQLVISTEDTVAKSLTWAGPIRFCFGGDERWKSVFAGVKAIENTGAKPDDFVLIHDAARPCVMSDDIDAVITTALTERYGAILATPVADTLKKVDDMGIIVKTADRADLWQAQTPQVFRLKYLKQVLLEVEAKGLSITDEASGFEQLGFPIRIVEGSRTNIKLTYPSDLSLIEFLLSK